MNAALPVVLMAMLQTASTVASAAAPVAEPRYFRFHRSVAGAPASGEACSVIDPGIFPNAAPSLKDLRVYQSVRKEAVGEEGGREVPYAITLSEAAQPDSEAARVLNLGMRGHEIAFDLEMPARSYTDVALELAGRDYVGTAVVAGSNTLGGTATRLGEFTLFDLTAQHLSHNSTLHLQESSFRYLHVAMTVSPAPDALGFVATPRMVQGATVPPSREAQTIYTTAMAVQDIQQRGRQTVVTASLPARVPIERVTLVLAPAFKGNFSRDVRITAQAGGEAAEETASGTVLRVHLTQAGREIRQQELSVPAVLGANLQEAARVEVAIENGDDAPLPVTAVLLEMRQRELCFDAAAAGAGLELFYGDAALSAPQYDFARLFSTSGHVAQARLGPEVSNDAYRQRADTRSMTERHPNLLWVGLLIAVCALAVVALRSSKTLPR